MMNGKIYYIGMALVILGLLVPTVGLVAADSSVENHRPEYVNCEYNESVLSNYQPVLEKEHLDVQPSKMYGTYCSSPEYDTDVAMFFAYYPVQEGFSGADSHQYDREPVYVFIDDETGNTSHISYSAYHYIKATDENPQITNQSRPHLYVVEPHHQYVSRIGTGDTVELGNFSEVHQNWYDNGWSANPEVTANPWAIRDHDSWWSEESSVLDYKASEFYWELRLEIDKLIGDPTTDI